jgi:hypothetical protein
MVIRRLCSLTVLGLSACSPTAVATRNMTADFQQANSCPSERISTTVRTDLAVHAFACADKTAAWTVSVYGPYVHRLERPKLEEQMARCGLSPPPAIAAEPERLAMWNAREAALWATYDASFSPVVEVSGCGKRTFYVCKWWHSKNSDFNCAKIVLKTETIPG